VEEKAAFCGGCGKTLAVPTVGAPVVAPRQAFPPIQPNLARPQNPLPAMPLTRQISRQAAGPAPKTRTWPVFAVLGLLVILFGGYRWYETGIRLTVLTNPPGSAVSLDEKDSGLSDSNGKLVTEHVARGIHKLTVNHDAYQPLMQTQAIGPFALDATINLTLQRQTYRITVQTKPPISNVFVDDKLAGKSDAYGTLIIPAITDGQHTLKIESPDLPTETLPIAVHSNDLFYKVDLAEKMAKINEEKLSYLGRAHALFQSQDFDGALAACDAVLAILPNDVEATTLKGQIQQTKAILSH